jgi:hypothetical protein
MALLHNNVFDAALSHISSNGVEAEVQNSTGSPLVDSVTLDTGNYGSPQDNASSSGGGRKITCLTSSASDMKNISVTSAGSAYTTAIKNASNTELVAASITSAPISLGASDQVNLSTFDVILKDPT